jgi:hypothetical protein
MIFTQGGIMKKHLLILIIMVAMVNLMVNAGYGGEKSKVKSKYMVIVSHTPEQCLTQLDEISAKGADLLNKFEWGCKSGDHTGYALIESESESAVKNMLPIDAHKNMKIVKVDRFTQEDLAAIHKQMKH